MHGISRVSCCLHDSGLWVECEFGYLPERLDVSYNGIWISTLPQFDAAYAWVSEQKKTEKGWFYPGCRGAPYPDRVFGLRHTHRICAAPGIEDGYVDFVLWVLSFFWGMRLTTLSEGFLDTTPIEPFALVDFYAVGDPVVPLMLAEQVWKDSASIPKERNRLGAAIHTMFMTKGSVNWTCQSGRSARQATWHFCATMPCMRECLACILMALALTTS